MTTAAKLAPLILLIVLGIPAVRGANVAWGKVPPAASLARASAFLVFAFLGVEAALVPSGEVRNPARTVPRAVFLAMLAVTVLYLAVQLIAQGTLGATLAASETPLADAAGIALGGWGRTLILTGAIVSIFGFICTAVRSQDRVGSTLVPKRCGLAVTSFKR
jgi:amino acid transporter